VTTGNALPEFGSGRLDMLLARAAVAAGEASRVLADVRAELVDLMARRVTRPWTEAEFDRYHALLRAEGAAQRRYGTAKRAFNHARTRGGRPGEDDRPPP
jgi:hypothetical protein